MAIKKKSKPTASDAAADASHMADPRFAKFESDPRFRLPSKDKTKTKLDKRFAHVLEDEDFTATTRVDRYGRKIKSDKKKRALAKMYRGEDSEEEEDSEGDSAEGSAEEDERDGKVEVASDTDVQRELQRLGDGQAKKSHDPARGGGFSASESDESSSDDDAEDSDDDDDEEEAEGSPSAAMQRFRDEEAQVPTGEVTRRLAIVNLDWDHVKARDLMAVFSSFVPKDSGGRIERISVYPSEFGKERMQQEELEGPPRAIFQRGEGPSAEDSEETDSDSDSDSDSDEKVKQDLLREEDDRDFDSNALRTYQLDRLRYYYGVMVCSDAATAHAIYTATDGREFQASSNFIDLRFVPDDVSFDEDEPRDSCAEVPAQYKPVEFVTEALQHSKVKLTWDLHPEDDARKDLMRRAFSGTPAELIENDLRAYLASDSDSDADYDDGEEFAGFGGEAETETKEEKGERGEKLSKKELARQKMRAALGLGEEEPDAGSKKHKKGEAVVGGMQITFTPALSDKKSSGSSSKGQKDGETETTLERYKRKEKERKELRKQKALAKREGGGGVGEEADADAAAAADKDDGGGGADLGFDDPFFTSMDDGAAFGDGPAAAGQKSKTALRKEERLRKRAEREAEAKATAEQKAQLERLLAEDEAERGKKAGGGGGGAEDEFDLKEVRQAEKARRKAERKKKAKKGKKGQEGEEEEGVTEEHLAAVVDETDARFTSVFSDPRFAIDPSNPRYEETPGMRQIVQNMRRKRKGGEEADAEAAEAAEAETTEKKTKKARTGGPDEEDLASLLKSVKRKAKRNLGA